MFGYVLPPLGELPQEEAERFRRAYCGLCHTLGRRYGPAARFILNYDFTFLAILLSEGGPRAVDSRRCFASPLKKREFLEPDSAMELAADESVILAYWQLRDGVADHDWLHGLKYRSLSAVLEPAYRKAAAARHGFDRRTREQLALLGALELEKCPSMDRAADAFAALLAGAAEEEPDPVRRRVLRQLLYHLGRWIYLVDAADDLKKDVKSGSYNPLVYRFHAEGGTLTAEDRAALAATLDSSVRAMAAAFELADFGPWRAIIESVVYEGLYAVGAAVLNGTFRKGRRRKQRKAGA